MVTHSNIPQQCRGLTVRPWPMCRPWRGLVVRGGLFPATDVAGHKSAARPGWSAGWSVAVSISGLFRPVHGPLPA